MVERNIRADAYSQLGTGDNVSHTANRESAYSEKLLETVTQLEAVPYRMKLVKPLTAKNVLL
jgi:hypothetical protein